MISTMWFEILKENLEIVEFYVKNYRLLYNFTYFDRDVLLRQKYIYINYLLHRYSQIFANDDKSSNKKIRDMLSKFYIIWLTLMTNFKIFNVVDIFRYRYILYI